jgi:preprotein translocase subunit SecG
MTGIEITLCIILRVLAVALVACVLCQSGKDKHLSGTIAGAAESFFGAGKNKTRDKMLSRITTILSFVFVVLAIVAYIYVAAIH